MRKLVLRVAFGLSFAVALAPVAISQTLEKVPFDKRLKLASVGDEEAQLSVGLDYETGDKAKVSKTEYEAAIATSATPTPRCIRPSPG